MRIKKLRILGQFKRFHDLTIDLGENPSRIVALVGPNGCGKSSVLDAMVFYINQMSPIGKNHKDYRYYSMTSTPGINHTNVEIDLNGKETWHQVYSKRAETAKQSTMLSIRSPYRYNSGLLVKQTTAVTPISNNNYGAGSFADLDQKMEESFKRLRAHYNKTLNDEDLRPTDANKKIVGELNASIQNCLGIKIVEIGDVESDRGTLYFTKADHPQPFEFNVLSSGEKEVIDILLDLYLRRDEFADTVFLIDEPELHINSSIQRKLFIEINKLIGVNCQIWIATHSVGLLRALQIDFKDQATIIEFDPSLEFASKAQVLKPAELGFRNWRRILSTALDDLTDLILPEQLIYCEGRDKSGQDKEERGFDAKVYNKIFGPERSQTLFVSSGGHTELDQRSKIALEIIGKTSKTLQILVLKDRDSGSGKTMTDADRKEYLSLNGKNHRMLLRYEIENYLFDGEVIGKYCATHGREFDGDEYAKAIGDLMNEDVKSKFNVAKNFCGITGSVSAEMFKLNLADYFSPELNVYRELRDCIFSIS